ncbi:MFS transporter [Dokdonella sp.]|uniref:MFS transporter n=1 Tax=Dokdonella sp. TaxID=2291710 RepID=UPI0025C442EA|nr:MFS transporter [Dokdonella sp.]MBX3691072.1 MFS transporter [Dokdonella sp.]MCW5568474.1 MFS transporter [Dokdonella sp.]
MTPPADHALRRGDVRTLVLAALGGALEFYDFIIFVFFAAVIAQVFFPPDLPEWLRQLQAFGIFAAGYLARPLGGIIMAHFGDRGGRKRMFMLSVLLMAVPTLLMGLLPTYADIGLAAPLLLLGLRMLQGAAVGGEVPGAWVFVSEHVPPSRVGFACGTLTAGLTFGILLGSLVASGVNATWTKDEVLAWAWRIPFVLGGVSGLLAVWLRRYLAETPVFEEMRRRRALVEGLPLRRVLAGSGREVATSMLLTWMLTAGIVVVILMTPTLVQNLFAIVPVDAARANSLATFMLVIGCIAYGLGADRWGYRRMLLIGAFAVAATTALLYMGTRAAPERFATFYAIAGFAVGVVGVVPTAMIHAFPPPIRFSGISFAYNIAYAISGGLTPLAVATWIRHEPNAAVYYVVLACVAGVIGTWFGVRRPSRG